jgi:hypothetical protein
MTDRISDNKAGRLKVVPNEQFEQVQKTIQEAATKIQLECPKGKFIILYQEGDHISATQTSFNLSLTEVFGLLKQYEIRYTEYERSRFVMRDNAQAMVDKLKSQATTDKGRMD